MYVLHSEHFYYTSHGSFGQRRRKEEKRREEKKSMGPIFSRCVTYIGINLHKVSLSFFLSSYSAWLMMMMMMIEAVWVYMMKQLYIHSSLCTDPPSIPFIVRNWAISSLNIKTCSYLFICFSFFLSFCV